MIRVRSLHVYPVKSCRGLDLEVAEVVATGFRFDRHWMVVDCDGRFLSQRSRPSLARVATRLEPDRLILETTGVSALEVPLDAPRSKPRRVTVWRDVCDGLSEGREAAEWFSALLGEECELVRQSDTDRRQVDVAHARPGDRVSLADGYPFLLVARASVDELNSRLAEPVPADRFRANIVVDGCPAHAEDGWASVTVGAVTFDVAKPCARCVVITTDQTTGDRSPEPLATLARYRTVDGKILFGQNLVHRSTGTIRVGDRVEIEPRF